MSKAKKFMVEITYDENVEGVISEVDVELGVSVLMDELFAKGLIKAKYSIKATEIGTGVDEEC